MSRLYVVRHGQASFGAADYDALSPLGEQQGVLLGQWLAKTGLPVDKVIGGSLLRHKQTLQACLQGSGLPCEQLAEDAGFNEYDHVEVIARAYPQFADPAAMKAHLKAAPEPRRAFQQLFAEAMQRWASGAHDAEYTESWPAFKARIHGAWQRLMLNTGESETIWVFTSGGPIACLTQLALNLPDSIALELNWGLMNTGITQLFANPQRLRLGYLNAVPHLELTGDPALISYR